MGVKPSVVSRYAWNRTKATIAAAMMRRLRVERRMLVAFNIVLCVAKETVFSLKDSVGLVSASEFPVNVNAHFIVNG